MNNTVQIDKNSTVYKELVNSTVRLTNYFNLWGVQTDLFGMVRVTMPVVALASLQLKYDTSCEGYDRIGPLVFWHRVVLTTLLGCKESTLQSTWNKKVPKTRVSKKVIHEEDLFGMDEAIEEFCNILGIEELNTYEDLVDGWNNIVINVSSLEKYFDKTPELNMMTDILVRQKFKGFDDFDELTYTSVHFNLKEYAMLLKSAVGSSVVFASGDNRVRASIYRISQLLHVSDKCGYTLHELCPNLPTMSKMDGKSVVRAASSVLPSDIKIEFKKHETLADAISRDENLSKLFKSRDLFKSGFNVSVLPDYRNQYKYALPVMSIDELAEIDQHIAQESEDLVEDFQFQRKATEDEFINRVNTIDTDSDSDANVIAEDLVEVMQRISVFCIFGMTVALMGARFWIVGNEVDPLVRYTPIGDSIENLWSNVGTFGIIDALMYCSDLNDVLYCAELLIESIKIGMFIKRSTSTKIKHKNFIFRDFKSLGEFTFGIISYGMYRTPDALLGILQQVYDNPKNLDDFIKAKFDIVARKFPNLDIEVLYRSWKDNNTLPTMIDVSQLSDNLSEFLQKHGKEILVFTQGDVYSPVDVIPGITNSELCSRYDLDTEDLDCLATLRFMMFFEIACNSLIKSLGMYLDTDGSAMDSDVKSGKPTVFDMVKEDMDDRYPSAVAGSSKRDTEVSIPVDAHQDDLMESLEAIKESTDIDTYKETLKTIAQMGNAGMSNSRANSKTDSDSKDGSKNNSKTDSDSKDGSKNNSKTDSESGNSSADKGSLQVTKEFEDVSKESASTIKSNCKVIIGDSSVDSEVSDSCDEIESEKSIALQPNTPTQVDSVESTSDNVTVLNTKPYLLKYKDLFNANWESTEGFNNTVLLFKKIFGYEPELVQVPELRSGEKFITGKHLADREYRTATSVVSIAHPSKNVITSKMYKVPRSDLNKRMLKCMNAFNKWKNKAKYFTNLPDWGLELPRFDESSTLAPAMYAEYTHTRSMLCAYEWSADVNGFGKEWVAHQAYLAMISPNACMTGLSSLNFTDKFEFSKLPVTLFNSDIERALDSDMSLVWAKEWLTSSFTKTVVISGDKGSGKTSLCRTLAAIAGSVFDRSNIYYITPNVFNRQAMQMSGVETILANQVSSLVQYTAYPIVFIVEDLDSFSSGGRDDCIGEFVRAMTSLASKFENLYFITTCDASRFRSSAGSIPSGNYINVLVDKDFVTDKSVLKVCQQILNNLDITDLNSRDLTDILHKCKLLAKKYITSSVHPRSTLTVFERLMMQFKNTRLQTSGSSGSQDPNDRIANDVLTFFNDNSQSIVKQLTGKDYTFIKLDSKVDLVNIESELRKSIKGQDDAIVSIARGLRRAYFDFKDPTRPIASMLFVGPTGVGKTGLVKALAKFQFGSESSMIRVDMSEYNMEFNISKFIGSPPGYVGYREGIAVTDKILQNPQSILLLDEIEKADPKVLNLLLQILEDGRITDACGTVVDCSNLIVIMTSNIGSRELFDKKGSLGFSVSAEAKYYSNQELVMTEVKRAITPELLNRLDQVVVFNSITEDIIPDIFDNIVTEVSDRFDARGINIVISDDAKAELCRQGFDPKFGARPLRRTVENKVVDGAILAMLNAGIDHDCKITVEFSTSEDDFKFDVVKSK